MHIASSSVEARLLHEETSRRTQKGCGIAIVCPGITLQLTLLWEDLPDL